MGSDGRSEKRRYRQWQHDEWNDDYRQLIPRPEPEDYTVITDYHGNVLKRTPELSGDYLTWWREPWKL